MIERLVALRKKIINGWNRAAYIGKYKDFPSWCDINAVSYDKAFYEAELKDRPIARIELCRVRLGNLRTDLFGSKYKMVDSPVYKCLKGEMPYSTYVAKLNKTGDFSHDGMGEGYPFELLEWTRNNADADMKWPIVVNPKDVIQDGQHRACCYLLERGEDAFVPAVRVYTLPAGGSFLQKILRAVRNVGRGAK